MPALWQGWGETWYNTSSHAPPHPHARSTAHSWPRVRLGRVPHSGVNTSVQEGVCQGLGSSGWVEMPVDTQQAGGSRCPNHSISTWTRQLMA